jgi:hypothetical protein
MKERYRLFGRRQSVYYAFDCQTKKNQSLETKDRSEAQRLVMSLNEAGKQPAMNLRLARVYLQHSDPAFSSRTWQMSWTKPQKPNAVPTRYVGSVA